MFTRMMRTDHNLKGFAYDVNDACYSGKLKVLTVSFHSKWFHYYFCHRDSTT